MKTKSHVVRFPLWLQLVLILLVGIILSVVVLWIVLDYTAERHTVTFAYGDGTVIAAAQVKDGHGVFPPVPVSDKVFRGWDKALNNVTGDLEVHPTFFNIANDNLFYFDSLYVKEGKTFKLDLYVAGTVCFSMGEIEVCYDPEVMEYKKASAFDACTITEAEPGKLLVTVESGENITEKTLLSSISFKTKKKDVYSSQISLTAKSVQYRSAGQMLPADCATLNNKIYFLQEVD